MWLSKIGFVLFVAGLLSAITGAAKMPSPGGVWPDTVPLCIIGLATCTAGSALWRIGLRREDVATQDAKLGPKALLRLIDGSRHALHRLAGDYAGLAPEAARDRIDSILGEYFEPVVENRFRLVEHCGMRHGAEILLQFAFVERYVNRVWSATADGCPAEAITSLDTAMSAANELSKMLTAKLQS